MKLKTLNSKIHLTVEILLIVVLSPFFNPVFSQNTNTVLFKTAKSLPVGMYGMASATDQKRIYIKGGGTSLNRYTSGFYAYDIALDEWLDFSEGTQLKPTRFGKGVYLTEFKTIAFIGGIAPVNNSIVIIPVIIGYNPDTYRFNSLGNSPILSKLLGATYWKGKVYMFGGSTSSESDWSGYNQKYTNKMFTYSPENGEIESLPDHPEAKEMDGDVINGVLYTFGGADYAPNKNIHTYNIEEKVWSKIGSFEQPISAYALVKYKHYFLLIGDYANRNQMIVFDTRTNTWEVYEINFSGSYMGAEIVENTLHVFGGNEISHASRQHWVLDLEIFLKD